MSPFLQSQALFLKKLLILKSFFYLSPKPLFLLAFKMCIILVYFYLLSIF